MKHYPSWMRRDEKEVVDGLVMAILSRGHSISIYDGEGWSLSKSRDYDEITANINQTDSTEIVTRDREGVRSGWFWLIHGNGRDVVSDFVDDEFGNEIWDEIKHLTEGEYVI